MNQIGIMIEYSHYLIPKTTTKINKSKSTLKHPNLICTMLVGTKKDLSNEHRTVFHEDGMLIFVLFFRSLFLFLFTIVQNLANQFAIKWMETSALKKEGIHEPFEMMAKEILT